MSQLRCLDLFCKAGGASRGLQQAGYHVTGVDIDPQPRYSGDVFIQADALTFDLSGFDLVWASPPCQAFTSLQPVRGNVHPNLIPAIRDRLVQWGGPYIIENVVGAPLHDPLLLCGAMFGLKVYRHRLFESNCLLFAPPHTPHADQTPQAGHGGISPKGFISIAGHFSNVAYGRRAMGIPWMTQHELAQAIPPAYAAYLGRAIMPYVRQGVAA